MKKVKSKFSLFMIAGITMAAISIVSCSKSSSNNNTPPPPTPIGGYVSSDSVAADALIAYWPFDGDMNDHKGLLSATVVGTASYAATGVRGKAYQGDSGVYATLVPPASFPTSLTSYTISFWYNMAANVDTNKTQGVFFYSGATQQGELIVEFESPANKNLTGDSLRIHPGFWDIGDAPNYALFVPETFNTSAIKKWVFFTVSYNGGTSTYTTYQNATPTGANEAFSNGQYITPNPLYTDASKATPLGNLKFTDAPQSIVIASWPDGMFGQVASKTCFKGQLDELRVFKRALTQQEISGLFLNGQANR
jgi:Concanavalin A-like lectin/glucanases superfamily